MLRRLVECLSRDRTKHQVAEVPLEACSDDPETCEGQGLLETTLGTTGVQRPRREDQRRTTAAYAEAPIRRCTGPAAPE